MKAEEMFKRLLVIDPRHIYKLCQQEGSLADFFGKHEGAAASYKRALETDPSHAISMCNHELYLAKSNPVLFKQLHQLKGGYRTTHQDSYGTTHPRSSVPGYRGIVGSGSGYGEDTWGHDLHVAEQSSIAPANENEDTWGYDLSIVEQNSIAPAKETEDTWGYDLSIVEQNSIAPAKETEDTWGYDLSIVEQNSRAPVKETEDTWDRDLSIAIEKSKRNDG
jgi:hypothetical protein